MVAAAVVGGAVIGGIASNMAAGSAADAAGNAADTQQQSARDSIAYQTQTRDMARSDLQPFRQFGQDSLAPLSSMLTQQGQTDYLRNNPLFKIGMDKLDRASSNTFLGRGQVGSANNQIVQNAFLAGQPLLQQQTNNLFNAANLGQSSAAGQANTALTTGAGVASTLEGAGNSRAAGIIGAGNAQAAGYQGIGNAFGSAAGAYAGYNQPLLYQQNTGYGYGSSIPSIYGNQGNSSLGYGQVAA